MAKNIAFGSKNQLYNNEADKLETNISLTCVNRPSQKILWTKTEWNTDLMHCGKRKKESWVCLAGKNFLSQKEKFFHLGRKINCQFIFVWASLIVQLVNNPPVMQGTPLFNSRVGKIPWRRDRLPTPVFWPGEFHGHIVHGVTKSQTWLSDFHFTYFCLPVLLLHPY